MTLTTLMTITERPYSLVDLFDLVFFIDSRKMYFYFQGTGCARGFLSAMDAAWMFRRMVNGKLNPLEIICERENIYKYVLTYLSTYLH